jgi:signal peptidase I
MSLETPSGPLTTDPLVDSQDSAIVAEPPAAATGIAVPGVEEQALLPIEFADAGAERQSEFAEPHPTFAEAPALSDEPPVIAEASTAVVEGPMPIAALVADAEDRTAAAWSRMWQEVVSAVQTLVSAAVYATLIVTFGFQVARVDGLSMAPTLEDHDRLIVNKLVYEIGDPRPGDIVMLYYPLNPEKMFVKRVIAKEGDTVRIVDGHVTVNDEPLHDDYVPAEFRSHDDWGPQVVQQGYYFVMGDHRNNSSDSRHWGPVPKKYIVGKVKVRWWPLQEARIF